MKIIKTISIVLILLVITMPISFADSIRSINIYGENNINNVVKASDIIKIETEVMLTGKNVSNQDVKISTGINDIEFNGPCNEIENNFFKCEHSEQLTIQPKRYNLAVKLFNENNLSQTKLTTYYVDHLPPKITILEQPIQEDGKVKIKYKVEELACQGCEGHCSGFKSIKVNGNEAEDSYDSCEYAGEYSQDITIDGLQNINIIAVDNFNQETNIASDDFTADIIAPEILDSSFRKGEVEYNYISNKGTLIDLHLTVKDERSDKIFIKADLSEINAGYVQEISGSCEKQTAQQVCIFSNINVNPGKQNANIKYTLEDDKKNTRNANIQYSFQIDNTAPKIVNLGSEGCKNDICYMKPGINKFLATIEETGSGFLNKNIIFDLSEIESSLSKAQAANCVNKGQLWECYGYANVPENLPHNSLHNIYVTDDSTDDVGHQIEGIQKAFLKVDKLFPVIEKVQIFASADDSGNRSTFYREGDLISIEATVKDKSPVRGVANLSQLLGSSFSNVETQCTGNTIQTCRWENIGNLITPDPENNKATATFTFFDAAQNNVSKNVQIEILFVADRDHNIWSVSDGISLTPTKIDKKTKPQLQFDVYATIPLYSNSNAKILSAEIINCNDEKQHLDSAKIIPTNSNNLAAKFKLNRKAFGKDEVNIKFNCEVSTVSQLGNFVTNPEYDNFSVTIPLYDMPLGSLGENTDRLIEDSKDFIFKVADKMKGLEKLLKIAEGACKIEQTLGGIGSIISIFTSVKSLGINAFRGTNAGKKSNKMWDFIAKIQDQLHPICEYSSCQSASTHLSNRFAGMNYDSIAGVQNEMYYPRADMSKNERANFDKKLLANEKSNVKKRQSALDNQLGGEMHKNLLERGFTDVGIWPKNPEDSLIMSIIALCPAGIIKNLRKYRQIQCTYVDCLQNKVPQGISVTACVNQNEYLKCKFIWGDVFQLIPFMHVWKRFGRDIKTMLSDPVSLIFGAGGYLCEPKKNPSLAKNEACKLFHYTKYLGNIVGHLKGLTKFKEGISLDIPKEVDMCKKIGK